MVVFFSMIAHIGTDVYLDLNCWSCVLHNSASSLLLLGSLLTMIVLGSLSVLVGDSGLQNLAFILFFKGIFDFIYCLDYTSFFLIYRNLSRLCP